MLLYFMKFLDKAKLLILFVASSIPLFGGSLLAEKPMAEGIRIEIPDEGDGWRIYDQDRLFAGYIPDSSGRPIIYPVIGPNGDHMTRDFPMAPARPTEKPDHDHHRSMWLTHGEVNEIDFWIDDPGSGVIRQVDGKAEVTDAGTALITTQNRWESADGDPVCDDIRRLEFSIDGDRRFIDVDVLIHAAHGDVRFGDTKEGTFGMRLAGTMKVDAKLGGQITNDKDVHDEEAWGQRSAWVDYNGPVDGKPVGVTMHSHPSSFGHPCRWHVRTYGLFAANPFGRYHFEGGEKRSDIVLKEGETMRLNYRVVLYAGSHDGETSAADFEAYANQPRPTLDPS